jgi:hypothetical protein
MNLSDDQAYAAMYAFLAHHYDITKSDDLGGLLGSMSLLPDGSPADPAIKADWAAAVDKAAKGKVNLKLQLVGP